MTADLHSLIAPYALDALEREERARFEAHLDQCPECQSELEGFMATAVRLGDSVAHTPPAALRDRLMSEIVKTPQERPVVTALAQRRGLRRTLPRLAAAAAVLIGAVGIGSAVVEHQNANEVKDRNVVMSTVIGAPDVTTVAKSFDAGGRVKLYASASADAAVIIAKDLPTPADGQVYQVWLVDDEGMHSHGYFKNSGQMIMEGVSKASRIAVTVEPSGGSKQPTTEPVANIPV